MGGVSVSRAPGGAAVTLPPKQGVLTHLVPWAPLLVGHGCLRKMSLNVYNKIHGVAKETICIEIQVSKYVRGKSKM